MAKQAGIWLRREEKFQRFGQPEVKLSYDQLIADGWEPMGLGEETVVFVKKDTCNSQVDVIN